MKQFEQYLQQEVVAVYQEPETQSARTVKGILIREDDTFIYISSFGSHTVVNKSALIKLKVKKGEAQ